MNENQIPPMEPLELPQPEAFDPARAAELARQSLDNSFTDPVASLQNNAAELTSSAMPTFSDAESAVHPQAARPAFGNQDYDSPHSLIERDEKIDALAAENAQLKEDQAQANYDQLTEVLNRKGLHAAYNRIFEPNTSHVRRGSDIKPHTLLVIDLDLFKHVNDQYGHPMGDAVLKRSAARLQEALRDGDVFGRWGGEEFLAILPDTDLETAGVVAERLRSALNTTPADEDIPVHQTASIGVGAVNPRLDLDQNVQPADSAVYEAKAAGRNTVRISQARVED